MTNEDNELITIQELCKLLKVKESHIRSLIFKKKLKLVRVGRLIRFRFEDIKEFLENNTEYI